MMASERRLHQESFDLIDWFIRDHEETARNSYGVDGVFTDAMWRQEDYGTFALVQRARLHRDQLDRFMRTGVSP